MNPKKHPDYDPVALSKKMYSKMIYKMDRLSTTSERELLYLKRKKAKAALAYAATKKIFGAPWRFFSSILFI